MSLRYQQYEHWLVVSGNETNVPYLDKWEHLKDHLRDIVEQQPGRVDICTAQYPVYGKKQGWAGLKTEKDADAAYNACIRSRTALVHIIKTCRGKAGCLILRCNCSSIFPDVTEGLHSAERCGTDLARIAVGANFPTMRHFVPAETCITPPVYTRCPPGYLDNRQTNSEPLYRNNSCGLPVNIRHGAVLTEARGIVIQNLSFNCTEWDLTKLLSIVGHPVNQELMLYPRTGAPKGMAKAVFRTQEQAAHAVRILNGKIHKNMKLGVRLDKEVTQISQAEPLIVSSGMVKY